MASGGNKVDHEDRQNLKMLFENPRATRPLADKQMKINLCAGQVKKTSVRAIAEEFKGSEVGQLLLNDGTLIVPVVDYVKAKHKIKSVETIERMERELKLMHQDLLSKGFTEVEAKNDIKEGEIFAKYQKL